MTKTNERINVPTDKQLYNYLQHQKKGSNAMNFAQLNKWCHRNKNVLIAIFWLTVYLVNNFLLTVLLVDKNFIHKFSVNDIFGLKIFCLPIFW